MTGTDEAWRKRGEAIRKALAARNPEARSEAAGKAAATRAGEAPGGRPEGRGGAQSGTTPRAGPKGAATKVPRCAGGGRKAAATVTRGTPRGHRKATRRGAPRRGGRRPGRLCEARPRDAPRAVREALRRGPEARKEAAARLRKLAGASARPPRARRRADGDAAGSGRPMMTPRRCGSARFGPRSSSSRVLELPDGGGAGPRAAPRRPGQRGRGRHARPRQLGLGTASVRAPARPAGGERRGSREGRGRTCAGGDCRAMPTRRIDQGPSHYEVELRQADQRTGTAWRAVRRSRSTGSCRSSSAA